MKTKVTITLKKEIIDTFFKLVPNMKRSQIIRNQLLNKVDLQLNLEKLNYILNHVESDEKKSFYAFLNETSLRKLDSLVEDLENLTKSFSLNEPTPITRSMIFLLILEEINEKYKDSPIPDTKSKIKPFYLPISDKSDLLSLISKREVTSSLEKFINEIYTGPTKEELNTFKKSPGEKMEILQLSLDNTAIEELDEYAKEFNANRSQVFRNVVKQLIESLKSKNNDVTEQLYNRLDDLVVEFKEVTTEDIILEAIHKYEINR